MLSKLCELALKAWLACSLKFGANLQHGVVCRSFGSGIQLVLGRALQKLLGFLLIGIFVGFGSLGSSGIRV